MNEQLLSLEQEREKLLENYEAEELSFYNSIIRESDSYLIGEVATCLVSTKEDGSNG